MTNKEGAKVQEMKKEKVHSRHQKAKLHNHHTLENQINSRMEDTKEIITKKNKSKIQADHQRVYSVGSKVQKQIMTY